MSPNFWNALDLLGRRAVPFVLTLALILVSVLPWPLPGAAPVSPSPALAAVYYWTLHSPQLMPASAVFALGLAQDILGGGPLGLSALTLLLVQGLVNRSRRHFGRAPFRVDWLGFALIAATAGAIGWVVASLYHQTLIWPRPLLVQYGLNVCLYPVLSLIFSWVRFRSAEARN